MKKTVKMVSILLIAALMAGMLTACGDGIPDGAEECRACKGSKECSVCNGDGVLEMNGNILLGPDKTCSFCYKDPGVCRTCDGLGYVYINR